MLRLRVGSHYQFSRQERQDSNAAVPRQEGNRRVSEKEVANVIPRQAAPPIEQGGRVQARRPYTMTLPRRVIMFSQFTLPIQNGVEFRLIPGFPGYAAGNNGDIWSQHGGNGATANWHILKPGRHQRGYKKYRLCVSGKVIDKMGHNLVMLAFVGPKPAGMQVRHFPDRDPCNNAVSNLSYGTPQQNWEDRLVHGTDDCGEKSHLHIATEEEVREIRKRWDHGNETQTDIAKDFPHLKRRTVAAICTRQSWKRLE